MDQIGLIITLVNFAFTVGVLIMVQGLSSKLNQQRSMIQIFKGHFTFISEKLDELKEEIGKSDKARVKELEALTTDISERIKTARAETLRENDNLRFLLEQLRNPKQ